MKFPISGNTVGVLYLEEFKVGILKISLTIHDSLDRLLHRPKEWCAHCAVLQAWWSCTGSWNLLTAWWFWCIVSKAWLSLMVCAPLLRPDGFAHFCNGFGWMLWMSDGQDGLVHWDLMVLQFLVQCWMFIFLHHLMKCGECLVLDGLVPCSQAWWYC